MQLVATAKTKQQKYREQQQQYKKIKIFKNVYGLHSR